MSSKRDHVKPSQGEFFFAIELLYARIGICNEIGSHTDLRRFLWDFTYLCWANTIRALEELARDDQLRTSVAEKGAEAVASKFSNAEQIGKLESIYLRVIEAAKR